MSLPTATQSLYDQTAHNWSRQAPSSLSDYTARPQIMALCAPLAGLRVLDLGCGEGYCSRMLKQGGAAEVLGLDLSAGMIDLARQAEVAQAQGIRYEVADATAADLGESVFDLVVAVFLFNYLGVAAMQEVMQRVRRSLKPGGQFVFAVPHPAFAFVRAPAPPFFFDVGTAGYFRDRDTLFPGKIWKRDGSALDVQMVHKTWQDYFDGLKLAGFSAMPTVKELTVTAEMVDLDPAFFGALVDVPLHMAVKVGRT